MSDVYGHAEAIGQVQTEEAKTFIFDGAEYKCITGDRADTKDLGSGGWLLGADKTIVALASEFAAVTPPEVNDELIIDGKSVFIVTTNTSPDGSFIVFGCKLVKGI